MKALFVVFTSMVMLSGCGLFNHEHTDIPLLQDPPVEPVVPPAQNVDPVGRWDSVNTPTGLVFNDTNSGIEFTYVSDLLYTANEYFITDKTETTISGSVVQYIANSYKSNKNPVIILPATVSAGTFVATVVDKDVMEMEIKYNNGDILIKTYSYSPASEIANAVDAVWSGITENRDLISIALNAGTLNGSDTSGCIYNGTTEVKNPTYNNITVEVQITNCPLAGSYYGVLQSISTNEAILSIIDTENSNIILSNLI